MTTAPPTHQPATAAMIGFSVVMPMVGTQRQSSGRFVTSAPPENASSPLPVRMATRCDEASKAANARCSSRAVSAQMALRRSGRLMAMTVVPSS